MFKACINAAVAYWGINYAYVNYVHQSKGKVDSITKFANDVITLPYTLLSNAWEQTRLAEQCQAKVQKATIDNFKSSGLSWLWNAMRIQKDQVACDVMEPVHALQARVYGIAGVATSVAYLYVAAPYLKDLCSKALPLCELLRSKLSSFVSDKFIKTTPLSFEECLTEFKQIQDKLNGKVYLEVSRVFLRGDQPVVELKTDLPQEKLCEILKQEQIEMRSLEKTPEGQCSKIHLKTVSNMDLCLTVKA
jgi:hypothetical protein